MPGLSRAFGCAIIITAACICPPAAATRVVQADEAFPLGQREGASIASEYWRIAQKASRAEGQGSLGWLFLLAALDFAPSNATYLKPVVDSYMRSRDFALAISHVRRAGASRYVRQYLARLEADATASALLSVARGDVSGKDQVRSELGGSASGLLPAPRLTLPFSTALARWQLYHDVPGLESDIAALYDATVKGYRTFMAESAENGQKSDTEKNHDFYSWQMEPFKATGRYRRGFEELPVFHRLISIFREAAEQYLLRHGQSPAQAALNAASRTVVWASVHTGESVHGPHNTEDSMVGGVFYVRVPSRSGGLIFSDPRGKNTVTQSPSHLPTPPFHRMYQVDPEEGLLILFPGWLVHQVAPSNGLRPSDDGFRVSFSFNLNGEWSETTPLIVDNVDTLAGSTAAEPLLKAQQDKQEL